MLFAVGTGAFVISPSSLVLAQARPLVRSDGGKNMIVWRNEKAHSEGVALISAGVNKTNPAVLLPLVACVVPVGDKVVVTDGGFFSSTVTVVSGLESGCRGVIANDYLRRADGAREAESPARTKDGRGDLYQMPQKTPDTPAKPK